MLRMKKLISICLLFAFALTLQPTVSVQAATQTSQFTVIGPITAYDGNGLLDPLGHGLLSIMLGENNGYGLMNSTGKVIIPPTYQAMGKFNDGLSRVQSGGKAGYIDTQGKVAIPMIYDSTEDFNSGFAVVRNGEKYGLINTSGKLVLPIKYDRIGTYSDGLIGVVLNGKAGFVDKTGNVVIPLTFEDCDKFSEGLAEVCQDGKWVFIDKTGKVVIPKNPGWYANFDFVDGFSDGVALVSRAKYGFVDRNGNIIVPLEYDGASNFVGGMGMVMKNGKYGFVNTSGQLTVPTIYDEANHFSEGYVSVQLGEKRGLVDRNGTVVLPIEYDEISPVIGGVVVMRKVNKSYIGLAPKTTPLSPVPNPAAPKQLGVVLNNKHISFPDQQPVIVSGRTLVPVRFISEALGAAVTWNDANQSVTIVQGSKTITLVIGQRNVSVDGKTVTLDVPAQIITGRTMVPLRFVSEVLGAKVEWSEKDYSVYITPGN